MAEFNKHCPTSQSKAKVKDLASCGIPKYLIARMMKLDDETLTKHYEYELETGLSETVYNIGKVVALQAEAGNEKSQALYLKTQGAKYGWVEKQVVENVSSTETAELKEKIAALEQEYKRDY